MRVMRTRAGWALMAVTLACGTEAGPAREAERPDAALDASAARDATAVDARVPQPDVPGANDELAVSVEAVDVDLCKGECTHMTARVRNAGGTMSYAWQGGLPARAAQYVCPEETTRYQVDVRSERSGEFAQSRDASDSLTISVRDCTPAETSRVTCELKHRADRLDYGDMLTFPKPWVALNTWDGASAIEPAPEDGAYLIGSFGHSLDLGAGEIQAGAAMSGFLHRMDARCQPLWTLPLRATVPGEVAMPSALATDAAGNAWVAFSGGPSFVFNLFDPYPTTYTTEFVLVQVSPAGEVLQRRRLPVGLGGSITDLAVDDSGQVYISGLANSFSDLGLGPIGLSPTSYRTFLAALDAQGRTRSQKLATGALFIEALPDGVLLMKAGLKEYDSLLGAFGVHTPNGENALAALTRDLTDVWQHEVGGRTSSIQAAARSARGGVVSLMQEERREDDAAGSTLVRSLNVVRFDAAGVAQPPTTLFTGESWTAHTDGGTPSIYDLTAGKNYVGVVQMSEQASGGIAFVGSYSSPLTLGGTKLTLPSPVIDPSVITVSAGLFAASCDAEDRFTWVRPILWGELTSVHGMAATKGGDLYVAGQARVPGQADRAGREREWDLIVSKLAAN
jgi:hypothetical protein